VKKNKNNIAFDIIKEENLIKYVIKSIGKDKVTVIPKNININFYTGESISNENLNIENFTMYFDDYNFHIIFYKQSFMDLNKINCSVQIKNNFLEELNEFLTYFIKIEGEIQNIEKYDEKSLLFHNKFKDTEFKLNDINKYKHFEINMRFHHISNIVINDKADPDIKETDKHLIEIMYPLINTKMDNEQTEFSDIDEECSNSEDT